MDFQAKVRMPLVGRSRLLLREGLFDLLDGTGDASCVWVCGPPGAGKSVLVQTWLQARQPYALWYHIDRSDADPAVLPHRLREAADEIASGLAQRLPILTPDRRGSIDAFASDFFSPLFEAMAATTSGNAQRPRTTRPMPVLVFDNIDEAIDSEPFAQLVAAAVECAGPYSVRIVIIGRAEPSGPFARLYVHERLTLIDGSSLRLTEPEAQDLVALRRAGRAPWSAADVRRLHNWCEGWLSGLVLACVEMHGAPPADLHGMPRDRLFRYLAATVLDRQTPAVRCLLLGAALLPIFSPAMAESVSGSRDAGPILELMAERNLFTLARSRSLTSAQQESVVYEFHALLREFLLARGRAAWDAATRRALLLRAAAALAADGQTGAAAEALVQARAWDELG